VDRYSYVPSCADRDPRGHFDGERVSDLTLFERAKTMTLAQESNESGAAIYSANDNCDHAPGLSKDASLTDEEGIADLVKRTERIAILVVAGMGACLILIPVIYIALTHAI